ncbi:MAG TPA: hypothetical protein VK470_16760, partial [Bacteroidota bacterium]|nr:hypothetical protein [Bacteroidota bacterium]
MKRTVIAALVLALACTSAFAQDFTFKFKKDKTYRYGMTSATAITQEVMGKEMKINVNSDIIYHLN